MAIDTNVLRIRVETLARKSQNGYADSVSWNSDLQAANLTIYEYYVKQFESTQRILDSLLPFVKEVDLPLTQGVRSATSSFPSNYFHRLECGVYKTVNADNDCDDPTVPVKPPSIIPAPCDYVLQNELFYTLSSGVRKPSIEKGIYWHTFFGNLIHVYPKETPSLIFKYLAKPDTPFWDSEVISNVNGDFEQFIPIGSNSTAGVPSTTVDIGFPEQEQENFTDLLLFMLGIEIKSTPLIEFVRLKEQEKLVK